MTKEKLPGQYRGQFRVDVAVITAQEVKDDSGMRIRGLQAADLMEQVSYMGDIERLDGRWTMVLQWVDLKGGGHRILVPHEVMQRVIAHTDRIREQARSDRARSAAVTRRERREAAASDDGLLEAPEGAESDDV